MIKETFMVKYFTLITVLVINICISNGYKSFHKLDFGEFLCIIFKIMIHKNSPKSSLWKLISTKNSKLHTKVTRRMRGAAMQVLLLLLCRLYGDAIIFSIFEKIQEPTTAEKRCQEQQPVCRRKELITVRIGSQPEKVL
jgi:hypothetical protein